MGTEREQQHRDETAEEEEDGEMGEWRQKRRVRKPQITTINHQAVNIFTCYDGLLLAEAWEMCVCVCACVQLQLLPLSRCLRLSLN